MNGRWFCRELKRSEVHVDPYQEAYFKNREAMVEAVVREGIQNSLDAAIDRKDRKVRVRYTFPGTPLPSEIAAPYLNGLEEHLKSAIDRSIPAGGMPYLVIEDFGTRGLTGDVSAFTDPPAGGPKNDFYYFWRNIGRSRKGENDLGRWGLGKTVFPGASQLHAFFGLTTRADDKKSFLMGISELRTHQVHGTYFCPYVYFARPEGEDEFQLPLDDTSDIARFRKDFGLTRGDDDAGLSIVIPYPDDEIEPLLVMQAVVENYFHPILAGSLSVEVVHRGKSFDINSETIETIVAEVHQGPTLERLRSLFALSRWALSVQDAEVISLRERQANVAQEWTEDLFAPGQLSSLRERYERRERLAIKAPTWVHKKGSPPRLGSFRVFLERDPTLTGGIDHYIRQGITISDMHHLRDASARGILVVDDPDLSELLGDSENPAHTEWIARQSRLKERFDLGPSTVTFVRRGLQQLVSHLSHQEEGRRPDLLKEVFSVDQIRPSAEKDSTGESPIGEDPTEVVLDEEKLVPLPPLPPPPQRRLDITPIESGFRIARPAGSTHPLGEISVRVAYEVRKGNAFNKYSPLDFDLAKEPIRIESHGVTGIVPNLNVVRFTAAETDFEVKVTGFDPRRDLKVRVSESEATAATDETPDTEAAAQ